MTEHDELLAARAEIKKLRENCENYERILQSRNMNIPILDANLGPIPDEAGGIPTSMQFMPDEYRTKASDNIGTVDYASGNGPNNVLPNKVEEGRPHEPILIDGRINPNRFPKASNTTATLRPTDKKA